MNKIQTQNALAKILKRLRTAHKGIVFTNGCFDILHIGHVDYLERAKRLGDCLVVGLNSDRSVRRLKGSDRPVNRSRDRARVLAALKCVDFVTVFEEETPANLIRKLMPDVIAKGGDWNVNRIVGSNFVRSYGGKAVSLPFVKGYSTSRLIKKIKTL